MTSHQPQFCFFLLALAAARIGRSQDTRISNQAPILNFHMAAFTPNGYREWLVRGSEGRYLSQKEIDVKGLTLTIFTGDAKNKVETVILSPKARMHPESQVVSSSNPIRVINDQFEVSEKMALRPSGKTHANRAKSLCHFPRQGKKISEMKSFRLLLAASAGLVFVGTASAQTPTPQNTVIESE